MADAKKDPAAGEPAAAAKTPLLGGTAPAAPATPEPAVTETQNLAEEMTEDAGEDDAFDLASLLPPAENQADEERPPLAILKHRRCRTFSVGRFMFKGYQLRLYTPKDVKDFAEVFQGLEPMHRSAIVTLNSKAQAAAERPFAPNVIHGAAATSRIPDAKSVK